ncbi:MAG: hypothetical protein OQK79_00230 [Rhodanobacter sp.]|jgi:hypothetical protein|nr:hypothetical protein [Rhodanobacter sp.]
MKSTEIHIAIPEGVCFADLRLTRLSNGGVSFDVGVFQRVCDMSSLDFEQVRSGPPWVACGIIAAWYRAARQTGEPMDLVPEQIAAESNAAAMYGLINVQPAPCRLQ